MLRIGRELGGKLEMLIRKIEGIQNNSSDTIETVFLCMYFCLFGGEMWVCVIFILWSEFT